jgi:hypothetical protein
VCVCVCVFAYFIAHVRNWFAYAVISLQELLCTCHPSQPMLCMHPPAVVYNKRRCVCMCELGDTVCPRSFRATKINKVVKFKQLLISELIMDKWYYNKRR